ncbi:chloride channel protein [Bosea vaviloviae]|jgi:CIC family chloride channel protein|uniref:chloride channel protein n=1 Tax=Bosea vaviloviae TaxID=1526658 RepID=UPI0009E8956C|nr:chloride channel protein [Bosea vaviloviae]
MTLSLPKRRKEATERVTATARKVAESTQDRRTAALAQRIAEAAEASRLREWIRSRVRGSEIYLTLLAMLIGATTGVLVLAMSLLAKAMHLGLYGVDLEASLSATTYIPPPSYAVPAVGGLLLGLAIYALGRWRNRLIVDPIEANALHGGRMSVRDSIVVALQTIFSNGIGGSVGLEAAYTQVGGALGSRVGTAFRLRRQDMRTLVGCGTAAAIAAAFNAPITGAFYAFELIIGSYAIATMAPVFTAAVAAHLITGLLGGVNVPLEIGAIADIRIADYPCFLGIGFACGLIGIGVMRLVGFIEMLFQRSPLPVFVRPVIGGLILGLLALATRQVLSGGHGALHVELKYGMPLGILAVTFGLKALASAVSLGSGFRGGLFFASLFLGALLGKIAAQSVLVLWPGAGLDPLASALIGMSALAVAIVGGPLTMTFLVLETTGDLSLTGVALAASIIASMTVRELFGYSFSTWRLHLRGETIRSAHDVGWIRSLTVGRMMRAGARTVRSDLTLAEFQRQFPLGSATRVIVIDDAGRYAGVVMVAEAHAPDVGSRLKDEGLAGLLVLNDVVLTPDLNVKQAIAIFERSESEALAVIDSPKTGNVLGILTEAHALRRYTEEMDQARRGAIGETG